MPRRAKACSGSLTSLCSPPNKPLKLTAAGFRHATAVLDTGRGSITRGRSLAAIR